MVLSGTETADKNLMNSMAKSLFDHQKLYFDH